MTDKRRKLIEDLADAMSSLKASFYHGQGPAFTKQGIGMPHFKLMMKMVASEDGISVGELSKKLHVTPGAITQFIDKLVDKSLVERYEDPKDRRIVRIKITSKAKRRFEKMKKIHFERLAKMFRNLNDDELKHLTDLIRKIEVDPEDIKQGAWNHFKK